MRRISALTINIRKILGAVHLRRRRQPNQIRIKDDSIGSVFHILTLPFIPITLTDEILAVMVTGFEDKILKLLRISVRCVFP